MRNKRQRKIITFIDYRPGWAGISKLMFYGSKRDAIAIAKREARGLTGIRVMIQNYLGKTIWEE